MKNWTINVNGTSYEIRNHGLKAWINETEYNLRKQPHRTKLLVWAEYDLPIEGAQVMLVTGSTSLDLIVDGINVTKGTPYHTLDKLPIWAYVFLVLNGANIINGAVGGALAVVGVFGTMRFAADPERSLPSKLLLSTLMLVGCWATVFVVGLLLRGLLY